MVLCTLESDGPFGLQLPCCTDIIFFFLVSIEVNELVVVKKNWESGGEVVVFEEI